MKIECWNCGCEYDENDGFCPECDADIEPNEPKTIKTRKAVNNSKKPFLSSREGRLFLQIGSRSV